VTEDWSYNQRSLGLGGGGWVGGLGVMRWASFFFWRFLVSWWVASAWCCVRLMRVVSSWGDRMDARVALRCWWVVRRGRNHSWHCPIRVVISFFCALVIISRADWPLTVV
jgi:hypothetical protein